MIAFCRAPIKEGRLIHAPKNLVTAFNKLKIEADFSEFVLDENDLKPYNKDMISSLRNLTTYSTEEIEAFISDYKIGVRQQRIDQITEALSGILSTYNQSPDVSAERIETKKGEGSTVHTALVALEAIDAFLKNSQNAEEFYKNAIEPHGPFVDGMARIFNVQGISDVRTLIGAPRKEQKNQNSQALNPSALFQKSLQKKQTIQNL